MSARTGSFRVKPSHIAAIFIVTLGSVSLMWQLRGHRSVLIVFAVAWVGVVGALAWELVTRAGKLDALVRARTASLEAANRRLSALLEQLDAFHHISYEMNQKIELDEICRTFTRRLADAFPEVDGVWLWLDTQRLAPEEPALDPAGPPALDLAAQCGRDFGMPAVLKSLRPDNPMVALCFQDHSMAVDPALRRKAIGWGWQWLAASPVESFAGFPLCLGETLLGILGIFSGRSPAREFLRQLNLSVNQFAVALEKARLLGQMQERAARLREINEELRRLDAMKDWFISSVSHEFRTPLTSIRSFSEILEHYDDLNREQRLEFARIIREESERLSEMIDRVLDMAHAAGGASAAKPEPFDLKPLVERCRRLFANQAEKRRIEFAAGLPDDLPRVLADELGVARVLNNLLGNAFKFTPDDGAIEVSAQAAPDGFVTALVTDTGVGIPPKQQAIVFDRFTQVDAPDGRKTPGIGIGLAICKELVEQWGGSIRVTSEPGKGSTFAFTMPVARDAAT